MKTKWTEGQQKVIDLRERNILVSAAAGSGKTAVLVERIIEKITDSTHPVDIDRLLVVTFTKAAAAEMRGRIGKALEERLQENPQDENIQRQLSLLHNAQITTIDSFCQYIIRNYFHVIGLDPMFQVGDETDLKLMQNEVLLRLLEERFGEARAAGNQAFLDFTEMFAPGRNDKHIEELVLKLYTISQSYPWPEEQLRIWNEAYQIASLQELMEAEWMQDLVADTKDALNSYRDMAKAACRVCREEGGPEVYLPAIQSDLRQIESLSEAKNYVELYEKFTLFYPERLKAARGKEIDPEKRDLVKELRKSYLKEGVQKKQKELFYQTPQEMLENIQKMASPVHELVQLTLDFADSFAAEKRENNMIDFNDMEHFALQILIERKEDGKAVPSMVAQELQQHFEEILTDEYQDSNFVQETILTSLCRAPKQEPYLFMVGDVKQSIYQFRLARPDLFMEKYNSYSVENSKTQRIDLHQNFRSRSAVLASANYLFERLMRKDFGGIVYDEAASLVPGADYGTCEKRNCGMQGEGQTDIILIEQKSDAGSELGKRSLEAVVIGERIREMVQGDQPLYVRGAGGYRPVEYRDIVILLRSLSGWSEEFIETLTDMGIPAYSATKTGYFSTLEVETMLNFLRIIDNPRQDIPLVAVLRSCLFEIRDEELAYLGTVRGTINYWDAICRVLREDEEIQIPSEMLERIRKDLSFFVETLIRYQEMARTNSVYELLSKIYREIDYYSIMSAMPAGEKRAANLDILLQQAIEFAENGHRGIFAFCRYIESLRKSDIDFGEASVNGENTNAVQIMSIHKSKGLEFPVVFVAGMGKQFNLMDIHQSTIIDMDYGIGAEYTDLDLRIKQPTLLHYYMKSHTRQNTLAEEVRILYVALTRAKEKLYLTGTVSGLEKKLVDWQQKGKILQRMTLLSARTYLDWIMPALVERTAYLQCMNQLDEFTETGYLSSGETDERYRIIMQRPEDVIRQETTKLRKNLMRKQELQEWDDQIVRDQGMSEAIIRQKEYQYPYCEEQNLPVKISVSELKRREMIRAEQLAEETEGMAGMNGASFQEADGVADICGIKIPRPVFLTNKANKTAAELGTLYHLVMEHLPYEDLTAKYDYDALLERMVIGGYMTSEEKELLSVKRFSWFMRSKIGKRMRQAAIHGKLHREQQFMMGIPANEVEPDNTSEEIILIQGIIDAYFEEEEELVLVDYKTDYVEKDGRIQLVERYRTQLHYYGRALEKLTGKRVKEKIIYSFSLGEEIIVE